MVSFDNASMPYKMVTTNGFEMADFIRAVTKEALLGGGVPCRSSELKRLVLVFINACRLCQLCRHCRNLAEGGCLLSRFHFTCCRYFLSHVDCRNLPWQGLTKDRASERKMEHKERPVPCTLQLEILVPALCYHTQMCRILCRKGWHPVDMSTCFV